MRPPRHRLEKPTAYDTNISLPADHAQNDLALWEPGKRKVGGFAKQVDPLVFEFVPSHLEATERGGIDCEYGSALEIAQSFDVGTGGGEDHAAESPGLLTGNLMPHARGQDADGKIALERDLVARVGNQDINVAVFELVSSRTKRDRRDLKTPARDSLVEIATLRRPHRREMTRATMGEHAYVRHTPRRHILCHSRPRHDRNKGPCHQQNPKNRAQAVRPPLDNCPELATNTDAGV